MRSEARRAARGGGRAHPHQPRGGSAGGDLPPEGRAARRTGRRWTRSSPGSKRRAAGPEDHGRHVHVHRGRDEPRRVRAALGARRRPRRDARSGSRTRRRARRSPDEMRQAGQDWENLCLLTGSPDRVLLVELRSGGHEAADRQDARRGREAARGKDPVDTRSIWSSSRRRRIGAVFFLMSEDEREEGDRAALGLVRIGRGLAGARGRLPEVLRPSARLRQLRPRARQVRAGRKGALARRGRPQARRRCRRRTWGSTAAAS